MHYFVDALAGILHVKPIPDCTAVAVYRERLIEQGTRNKAGNNLFQVLLRPVLIEWPYDTSRNAVTCNIGIHQTVCTCFGTGIRRKWVERMLFGHRSRMSGTIHFARRNMNEPV